MLKKLTNEVLLRFDLKTESPLLVRSSSGECDLEPVSARIQYLKAYRINREDKRELIPIVPGSSIKGIFRSYSERLLDGCCNILEHSKGKNECLEKIADYNGKPLTGTTIYSLSCPACRLFGNLRLKSRISFKDAYPKEGTQPVMGIRNNVAIDRFKGSAKEGALFDTEVVEDGIFVCEIKFENAAKWHIKLILNVLENVNEGFVTFGGGTTKGFGRMKVDNFTSVLRRYDNNLDKYEKRFGFKELKDCLNAINILDEITKGEKEEKFL